MLVPSLNLLTSLPSFSSLQPSSHLGCFLKYLEIHSETDSSMLLKPLTLAVAALAAGTGAFLVPPEISESDINIVKALPVATTLVPDAQKVMLPCPGCSIQVNGPSGPAIRTDSSLELLFRIVHGRDHDMFFVNELQLFPLDERPDLSLYARVLPNDPALFAGLGHKLVTPRLGYGIKSHQVAMDKESQLGLSELDLQIIEVGTTFIDGIPNVHIKLVTDSNGRISIADLQVTESLPSQPSEGQDDKCGALCGWITFVKDMARKKFGKPCHGKMGHRVGASEHNRQGRPHHKHHHKHHGGGRVWAHHRSWRNLLKNIASHILLPVAVGIVAGVTVSL
jgi:hypothetical protein